MYHASFRIAELRRINEVACTFFSAEHSAEILPTIFERIEELRLGVVGMVVTEEGETYTIGYDKSSSSRSFIICKRCGMKSYHPKDIEEKYCGKCRRFHNCFSKRETDGEQ